jgi:hypothetical protein
VFQEATEVQVLAPLAIVQLVGETRSAPVTVIGLLHTPFISVCGAVQVQVG